MAKIEKIEDHARCITDKTSPGYFKTRDWKCKYCETTYTVWYQDFKTLRAHLRRRHPMEYKPYTINEEPEHEDRLSLLWA